MQFHIQSARKLDYGIGLLTVLIVAVAFVFLSNTTSLAKRYESVPTLEFATQDSLAFQVVDNQQLPIAQSNEWAQSSNPINLGMTSRPHWFHFRLPLLPSNKHQMLEVAYPLIDELSIWFVDNRKETVVKTVKTGDAYPFSQREVNHATFLFAIPESDRELDVYIQVSTSGTLKMPIRVWNEQEFLEHSSVRQLLIGIFFGFLVAMAFSNLFFFLTTGANSFIVYVGYVVSIGLTLASLHGVAYANLWPNLVWFQSKAVVLFANATILFAVIFSNQVLQIRQHSQRVHQGLNLLALYFLVSILLSIFLPYAVMMRLFLVSLGVVVSVILAVGIWLIKRGLVIARYYSFAWVFLLASGFAAGLDHLNIVPVPIDSNYLLVFGALIETMLLSLVLAISYSRERYQLYLAKEQALAQEKAVTEAKEALIQAQQQSQDELEYKVQERTLELEITLRELSEVNRELERLNTIDPLTGIKNRRHFDKRLLAESRRSRREQTQLSVAMIDIDHFKAINDKYGHGIGDECLKHVANLISLQIRRPSDHVCRYGGEEFSIILPSTDVDGALVVVESMRRVVEATPLLIDESEIYLTFSGGVATMVVREESQEHELLAFADKQLYEAKAAGRNRVLAATYPGN